MEIPPEIKRDLDAADYECVMLEDVLHGVEGQRITKARDQLKKSLDLYNKQTKTILKLEKELEELRSDYRLNL